MKKISVIIICLLVFLQGCQLAREKQQENNIIGVIVQVARSDDTPMSFPDVHNLKDNESLYIFQDASESGEEVYGALNKNTKFHDVIVGISSIDGKTSLDVELNISLKSNVGVLVTKVYYVMSNNEELSIHPINDHAIGFDSELNGQVGSIMFNNDELNLVVKILNHIATETVKIYEYDKEYMLVNTIDVDELDAEYKVSGETIMIEEKSGDTRKVTSYTQDEIAAIDSDLANSYPRIFIDDGTLVLKIQDLKLIVE